MRSLHARSNALSGCQPTENKQEDRNDKKGREKNDRGKKYVRNVATARALAAGAGRGERNRNWIPEHLRNYREARI